MRKSLLQISRAQRLAPIDRAALSLAPSPTLRHIASYSAANPSGESLSMRNRGRDANPALSVQKVKTPVSTEPRYPKMLAVAVSNLLLIQKNHWCIAKVAFDHQIQQYTGHEDEFGKNLQSPNGEYTVSLDHCVPRVLSQTCTQVFLEPMFPVHLHPSLLIRFSISDEQCMSLSLQSYKVPPQYMNAGKLWTSTRH